GPVLDVAAAVGRRHAGEDLLALGPALLARGAAVHRRAGGLDRARPGGLEGGQGRGHDRPREADLHGGGAGRPARAPPAPPRRPSLPSVRTVGRWSECSIVRVRALNLAHSWSASVPFCSLSPATCVPPSPWWVNGTTTPP